MPPIKVGDSVDLLRGSTLTLPPSGVGRVEKVVDPEQPKLEVDHPDQFSDVRAVPMGTGDVKVLGAATRWDPKRETPISRSITLGNPAGVDALYVVADSRHLSGRPRYEVVIRSAANQDEIQAALVAFLDVTNTGRDFSGAVQLLLNQPPQQNFFPWVKESLAKPADPVMRSAGGAVVLPISTQTEVPGQTDVALNISSAVNGTPAQSLSEISIRLRQKLTATLPLSVGPTVDALSTQKVSPDSTFELSGTGAPRPAGEYKIYEEVPGGLVESGGGQTQQYTEKGAEVAIPGVTYRAIELESRVRTTGLADLGPGPNGGTRFQATLTGTLTARSQTPYARTVKVALPLNGFEKVQTVDVRVGAVKLPVAFDADRRTALVEVPVKGNAVTSFSVSVVGDYTQY